MAAASTCRETLDTGLVDTAPYAMCENTQRQPQQPPPQQHQRTGFSALFMQAPANTRAPCVIVGVGALNPRES